MVCSLSNYQPISSHIFKQNHASNLSSTFLSSPSSIHLFSDLSICLQFRCNNKKLCSSTPRPLTVIAMVPPKLGGKANKVTGITKPTLEARKAKPAPPVGPTLGSKGGFV